MRWRQFINQQELFKLLRKYKLWRLPYMESIRHVRSRTGFCILVRKKSLSSHHCSPVSRHELCTKAAWALGKKPRTQGNSIKQMEKTGLLNDTSASLWGSSLQDINTLLPNFNPLLPLPMSFCFSLTTPLPLSVGTLSWRTIKKF